MALGDLQLLLLLRGSVARDPSVVAGLVSIGMGAIGEEIVTEGLDLHAWNDAELAQLQDDLGRVDFLSQYVFSMKGELAGKMHDFPSIRKHVTLPNWQTPIVADAEDHRPIPFYAPWPAGWADGAVAKLIRFESASVAAVDPEARRVYPQRAQSLGDERARHLFAGRYIFPWNFLFMEMSMESNGLAAKAARAQVFVDHSVIACALERYRLAHGKYPASLEELEPVDGAKLPHDPINGENYHYRSNADGSYLLYSVGWNDKDDGGKIVDERGNFSVPRIDYDQGDWVWFGPK